MQKKIRCCKCFITLESLRERKLAEYLIKTVNSEGKEEYICPICLGGW